MEDLLKGRAGFEAIGRQYAAAENVSREDVTLVGIPCAWLRPAGAAQDNVAFYIHGGGFMFGSLDSHTAMVSHLAATLLCNVLLMDYRLAPEHPFPAGLQDCVAVITAFCKEQPGVRFGIIGDSAGGNIATGTQLMLRDMQAPLPQYSILISPWTDLTCTNDAFTRNQATDHILSRDYLLAAAKAYAGSHAVEAGLLSPVHASLEGLPPTLLLYGTVEILEDDAIVLHERLVQAGVAAERMAFEGEQHVWPFNDIHTPASQRALEVMKTFAAEQLV